MVHRLTSLAAACAAQSHPSAFRDRDVRSEQRRVLWEQSFAHLRTALELLELLDQPAEFILDSTPRRPEPLQRSAV